jgi:formate-dependent nitrite reductase membrane component NrfD
MTSDAAVAMSGDRAGRSSRGYYGLPVIHHVHWKWLVVGYFFLGGISGGSAFIAAAARLAGGRSAAPIARIATAVSFATLIVCPVLLILDLGRPKRFLNMLRVFRPTSPMSMGTGGLTAFGLVSTISAGLEALIAWQGTRPTRCLAAARSIVSALCGALGLFVAGYTGVVLASTAVPIWSKQPKLLGPLFLSSAMTSAGAAVSLISAFRGENDSAADDALRELELCAALVEGMLLVAWIAALDETAKPLSDGHLAAVVRHGVGGIGLALPALITAATPALPQHFRRSATIAASVMTLIGGFALRYAVVLAGRLSADDPEATFEITG